MPGPAREGSGQSQAQAERGAGSLRPGLCEARERPLRLRVLLAAPLSLSRLSPKHCARGTDCGARAGCRRGAANQLRANASRSA